jgi:tyrosyl-tRNA synthetase
MTSPFALHQFLLNSDDVMVPSLLRFFTFLDHDTIRELDEATKTVPQERRAQRAAANAIVAMVHGDDAARKAERAGDALFSESIADVDEATLLHIVADAPSSTCSRPELNEGIDLAELLVRCDLAASLSEARRFLAQGGVYVNNVRVDGSEVLDPERALHGRYYVLRRGRRQLHLLVVQ